MAIVQTSSIISNIVGSVGGSTFQNSSGGLMLRSKPFPRQKNSPAQSRARVNLSYLQTLWAALDDNQRSAWSQWADYAGYSTGYYYKRKLTGQETFILLNSYRLILGIAVLSNPVFTTMVHVDAQFELFRRGNNFWALFTMDYEMTEYRPLLFLSGLLGASRIAEPARKKLFAPNTFDGFYWDLTDRYRKQYGRLPEVGDRIWSKSYIMENDSGHISPPYLEVVTIQLQP